MHLEKRHSINLRNMKLLGIEKEFLTLGAHSDN